MKIKLLTIAVAAAATLTSACVVSGPTGCALVQQWIDNPSAVLGGNIATGPWNLYSQDGELQYVVNPPCPGLRY